MKYIDIVYENCFKKYSLRYAEINFPYHNSVLLLMKSFSSNKS